MTTAHETRTVSRADLVAYAAASGDLNPIHWHERSALAAGLDDVIAHGMLTLGMASATLVNALDDPGRIDSIHTRFSRPLVVPDLDEGVTVDIEVSSSEVLHELVLTVRQGTTDLLGNARVTLRDEGPSA